MNRLIPALLAFGLFGSGCIIVDDDDPPATGCRSDLECPSGYYCAGDGSCLPEVAAIPIYDPCTFVDECEPIATHCQEIIADWGDRSSQNNICTYACDTSDECRVSANGLQGVCASFPGTDFVCYEQCVDGGDCGAGFDCGTIDGGYRICLPR